MDKKQLSIICAGTIIESNLPKESKLQMLTFIKEEASETQLKTLLMDSKIVSNIDEITEEIINDRFENFLAEGIFRTILGVVLLSPPGWAIYRSILASMSEKNRRCGILGVGKTRDLCKKKVSALGARQMAGLLKKSLANCKDARNPEKCTKGTQDKIKKFEGKAKKIEDKLRQYGAKSVGKSVKVMGAVKKAENPDTKIV